jgi:hypothetical protein
VNGRFVDAKGQPVAGVRVTVGENSWRSTAVQEQITGEDGRFTLNDVSVAHRYDLTWFPPQRWKLGRLPLRAGIGEEVQAGDIRLEQSTTVRAAVAFTGGSQPERDRVTVVLVRDNMQPRIVGERQGSFFVFRDVPFEEARIEVSTYQGQSESYKAPVRIARGSHDQVFYVRAKRETVKQKNEWEREGELEVHSVFIPMESTEREFRAKGRIVGPDGEPVPGALANLGGGLFSWEPMRSIATGPSGEFEFRYRAASCRNVVATVHAADSFFGDAWSIDGIDQKAKSSCEQVWSEPRTFRLTKARRVDFSIDGVAAESPWTASWLHPHAGWIALGGLRAWAPETRYGEAIYKLDAPGRMPLVGAVVHDGDTVRMPSLHSAPGTRKLVVTAGGKALSNAKADLELIRSITSSQRIAIATYPVDASGSLRLEGGADQLIEAFVFADGHEPVRAIWTAGEPLRFDLKRRDAMLRFPDLQRGDTAFVTAIGTQTRRETTATEMAVAAGVFDVLIVGALGETKGHARAAVKAGESTDVRVSAEALPRVIVKHASGCRPALSQGAQGMMPVGFAAYSFVSNGTAPRVEPWARVDSATPTETVFVAPGPGRYQVNVSECNLTGNWWREVVLRAGAAPMVLTIPTARASLKGSMRAFPAGAEIGHHGTAGPRMQLIADDPEAWSVTIGFPDREGATGYLLKSLPVGRYHVMQHLIGEQKSSGNLKYTETMNAWGGIEVALEAGKTAELRDFMDYPQGPLAVMIEDENGRPLEGATLRVIDRMSSSWNRVATGGTTLSNASYPIPPPAAARIVSGRAELPLVRRGLLEVDIERDDGFVTPFRVMLREGETLRLRMPASGGAR